MSPTRKKAHASFFFLSPLIYSGFFPNRSPICLWLSISSVVYLSFLFHAWEPLMLPRSAANYIIEHGWTTSKFKVHLLVSGWTGFLVIFHLKLRGICFKESEKKVLDLQKYLLLYFFLIWMFLCISVTAQEPRGDQLLAATAAAPGCTESQPITAAVPGLLTEAGQCCILVCVIHREQWRNTRTSYMNCCSDWQSNDTVWCCVT